jgi:hypothetical protein
MEIGRVGNVVADVLLCMFNNGATFLCVQCIHNITNRFLSFFLHRKKDKGSPMPAVKDGYIQITSYILYTIRLSRKSAKTRL